MKTSVISNKQSLSVPSTTDPASKDARRCQSSHLECCSMVDGVPDSGIRQMCVHIPAPTLTGRLIWGNYTTCLTLLFLIC